MREYTVHEKIQLVVEISYRASPWFNIDLAARTGSCRALTCALEQPANRGI